MRTAAWLALVAAISASCTSGHLQRIPQEDPLLAMLKGDRETMTHLGSLLAASGFSRFPGERAAFIVNSDQGFGWIPWPDSGGFHQAAFRGSVPPRCLAIVHTHPIALPEPSAGDRRQAERLQLPIVAVTPRSLAVVWPDGDRAMVPVAIDKWLLTVAERGK